MKMRDSFSHLRLKLNKSTFRKKYLPIYNIRAFKLCNRYIKGKGTNLAQTKNLWYFRYLGEERAKWSLTMSHLEPLPSATNAQLTAIKKPS